MVNYSVIEININIAMQRGRQQRHVDFEDAFPNGKLERLVYMEFSKTLLMYGFTREIRC